MFPLVVIGLLLASYITPALPLVPTSVDEADAATQDEQHVQLEVPFIWEIPDGAWTPPWSGACEEASVSMVNLFYKGDTQTYVPHDEMKSTMSPLFTWEDKTYGSSIDSNAARTSAMAQANLHYDTTIKTNPTHDEIKEQLREGHPVISLHYGYDLKNPRHRFRAGGSSYHMMVITGYDDEKGIFYVNDPELKDGRNIPYTYDTIMNSLHDFDHMTKRADGPPTVIFTSQDGGELMKSAYYHRVYLVLDGVKHYVTDPRAFATRRLPRTVRIVDGQWLASLPDGSDVTP